MNILVKGQDTSDDLTGMTGYHCIATLARRRLFPKGSIPYRAARLATMALILVGVFLPPVILGQATSASFAASDGKPSRIVVPSNRDRGRLWHGSNGFQECPSKFATGLHPDYMCRCQMAEAEAGVIPAHAWHWKLGVPLYDVAHPRWRDCSTYGYSVRSTATKNPGRNLQLRLTRSNALTNAYFTRITRSRGRVCTG
ncbi:hypothetical protein Cob_v009358 [Colletotrichum orbiculare MAFF 240422]|uniref:Uncharacterized protein n=1 Tax=Colletotrichum orbiculare (strain 104-T / ATCC 96160 / CBS 514.97 / LARS 414 / MAFF 240422) TaxID=1213857 RepID=A0A484FI91_COLOR|nr:hypothetical protein Cob_v009358 [Colletotrichum orbiculare MAFF 240422]